jgi:hypothetical protein
MAGISAAPFVGLAPSPGEGSWAVITTCLTLAKDQYQTDNAAFVDNLNIILFLLILLKLFFIRLFSLILAVPPQKQF